jgi:hypothetical protein
MSLSSSPESAANRLDEYLATIIGPHGPKLRTMPNGDQPCSHAHAKTDKKKKFRISDIFPSVVLEDGSLLTLP